MQVMVAKHVFRLVLMPDDQFKVLMFTLAVFPLPDCPPYGRKQKKERNKIHACSLG